MALLKQAPSCSSEAATLLAGEIYGLRATATPLPSERDQNFLLQTESGERFVLKLANALEDRRLLEAQNLAMAHIARSLSFCPRIVPAKSGDTISETQSESGSSTWCGWLPIFRVCRLEVSEDILLNCSMT